jgi:hypothetical protein
LFFNIFVCNLNTPSYLGVGEIINGKVGFLKLNEIKKTYRDNADKIRQLQSRMLKIEIKREPAKKTP